MSGAEVTASGSPAHRQCFRQILGFVDIQALADFSPNRSKFYHLHMLLGAVTCPDDLSLVTE